MKRRGESKEAKGGGVVAQGENGDVLRFGSASGQFHTRCCVRCAGLLVQEWCYDLNNTGEHNAKVLRCVQCGHRIDPVIVLNQVRPLVAHDQVRPVQHQYVVRTELRGEAA